jgi:NADPH:quinone reductase-like Zn-dependent oxidoreductase
MDNETLVFPAAGEFTLEDRPVPDLRLDEVLIETTASLVSTGTELTLLSGEFPPDSAWSVHGLSVFD